MNTVLVQENKKIPYNAEPKPQVQTPEQLVESLLALPNFASQQQFLSTHIPNQNEIEQDAIANLLKKKADHFLRSDIQQCLNTADLLLFIAGLTNNLPCKALGLGAKANAFAIGGLGEYRKAIKLYEQLAKIYQTQGNVVMQAATWNASLFPLANLGRIDEAIDLGQRATAVFEKNNEPLWLAKLCVNLGIIYRRLGEDVKSLELYNQARDHYLRLQDNREASRALGRVEQNRATVLRNLGQFEESIQASQTARKILNNSGQIIGAARAHQNLSITYFVLGRYNEALELLEEAKDVFIADGRRRDALLNELRTSDCLLQLRRFRDVLNKCQQIRTQLAEFGIQFEVAQSILNEAVAYAGLELYDEALAALREARALFAQEDNNVWVASTDLETAVILLCQRKLKESLEMSSACAQIFEKQKLPREGCQALLVATRAATELTQYEEAQNLVTAALAMAERHKIPALLYQGIYLLGSLTLAQGELHKARLLFDQAATELEQLRGQLMIEFRANFLEDKQVIYEDLVQLCLTIGEEDEGLMYAERAKSRALLELLAFRLNLGINARSEDDQPLVDKLTYLREKRDRQYRRWASNDVINERGKTTPLKTDQPFAQENVLALEKQITELWHKLLIRNADYARDAALWQVRTEPFQSHLDEQTVLVEYFIAKKQIIAFVVTRNKVQAYQLPGSLPQIHRLLQLFWLNLRAVPTTSAKRMVHLTTNARGILQQLNKHLVAPFRDSLDSYRNLIIVPHGPLHYLPFHALHDGDEYLLSQFEVCYLPSASFLTYGRKPNNISGEVVAIGHSYNNKLPNTIQEARSVTTHWQGQLLLEDEATLARVKEAAVQSHILHFAAHADFRPDNPLFSGLALADGWLTTLDIFSLRLQASLVTLSACQTGRSVIGGGDELLGLMRAFLSAGAASLLLTLWAVEDHSTAQLMEKFYAKLAKGWGKAAALRQVQLQLANGKGAGNSETVELYKHPYFWAPFYLVGDTKPL